MSDILGMLRTATQLNQIAEEHFDIVGAKFRNFGVKDVRIRNSKQYIAERGETFAVSPRDAIGQEG